MNNRKNCQSSVSKDLFRPELLLPAGGPEQLKVACLYGADAIYLGGPDFGMRQAAPNFSYDELSWAVDFAKKRGVKVFITLNNFVNDTDLERMASYLHFLEEIKVSAFIISDLGLLHFIKNLGIQIPLHLSTQASCLNSYSGKFWQEQGIERLILAREVTPNEAAGLKNNLDIEVELFIHGAMCSAFSGHCTISNYTSGRDSNRGGCAQSCRFEYTLAPAEEGPKNPSKKRKTFMSSKDLEGVSSIEKLCQLKIDSLKIEGRMKSPLYVATTTRIYRALIDEYAKIGQIRDFVKEWAFNEIQKLPNREYTSGANNSDSEIDWEKSIYHQDEAISSPYQVAGNIVDIDKTSLIIEVKKTFTSDHQLECLSFSPSFINEKQQDIILKNFSLTDLKREKLIKTKPNTFVRIELKEELPLILKKGVAIRAYSSHEREGKLS